MAGNEQSHSDELGSIRAGLKELEADQTTFGHPTLIMDELTQLWQPDWIARARYRPEAEPRPMMKDAYDVREPEPRPVMIDAYDVRESDWYLGMTREFVKAVQDIDRKLQGRILKALSLIITRPTVAKGNTVQPLTGDLKGLWRYRIGNYRLIYHADTEVNP